MPNQSAATSRLLHPARRAWLPPAAILILLLGSTLLLYRLTAGLEDRAVDQRFAEQARDRVEAIRARVENIGEDILDVGYFFDSSDGVERDEFHRFCKGILDRHQEILAISWNPRVLEKDLAAFMETARKGGRSDYRITELGHGPPVAAGPAPIRYPIYYREPDSRPQDFGIDLYSDPLVREALAASITSRQPVLTGPAEIPGVFGAGTVLRDVMPIFSHPTVPEGAPTGAEEIEGCLVLVLRADRLLADSISTLAPAEIDVDVDDVSGSGGPSPVGQHRCPVSKVGGGAGRAPRSHDERIEVAGRQWVVCATATPEFEGGRHPWGAWAVLASGIVVSLLIAWSVRRALSRAREVEQLVEKRTAELRDSERRLQDILDNSPSLVVVRDMEGRATIVNRACERVFGRPQREVVGRTVHDLFPRETAVREEAGDRRALASSAPVESEEVLPLADGRAGTFLVIRFALRGPDGRPYGVCGVATDISDRKRIEEETIEDYNRRLEGAVQDLERAQRLVSTQERLRALGQMASGIAHDFNNALSPVLGFSELLLADPRALDDREKAGLQLRSIQTAALDAASIVRRLKAFYRQQEEEDPLLPVDLDSIVREAIGLTRPRWKDQALSAGASIEVRHEAGGAPPVLGAEAEIREALTNLVFNAVDAMPKGGTITVSTRVEGSSVVLAVRDTGAGMTEEVRLRCLEPFFTTKGTAGTGMGLAMVYGIMRRHGGSVDIESTPGAGTTVRLRFPVAAEAAPKSRENTRIHRRRVFRVLVVDDEPLVREVLKSYLELDGHEVGTASDGEEGVKRFLAGEWDLVVTDSAMPRMNGDEVAARVKAARPAVPVIQVTGFGSPQEGRARRSEHVDAVLAKPVTIEALRSALQEFM